MRPAWLTDSVTVDLSRAVRFTLLWGLEGVVLRTVGGTGDRVPFVNEARLRERLREADLPIEAVDPGLFEAEPSRRAVWMNDLVAFEETAAFCRRVGCDLVLVGALAEPSMDYEIGAAAAVLREAGAVAANAGLRLAVRNTAEGQCASGETLAALLASVGHAHVGAAWSPADALEAGHDPKAGLQALREHAASVFLVTIRDGWMEEGAWSDCTPGEGTVDWPAQLAELKAMSFDGPLVLEVQGAPRPKAGLREATALIHLIRSARQAS